MELVSMAVLRTNDFFLKLCSFASTLLQVSPLQTSEQVGHLYKDCQKVKIKEENKLWRSGGRWVGVDKERKLCTVISKAPLT